MMGKTKFLQFTGEEFVHLFTGLKRDQNHHDHQKVLSDSAGESHLT